MAQVINIGDALGARAKPGSYAPNGVSAGSVGASVAGQPSVTRESVYRAILLLDLATQQMRVLLRRIADPSRKSNLEAQITAIERSIQHARDMALKL